LGADGVPKVEDGTRMDVERRAGDHFGGKFQ